MMSKGQVPGTADTHSPVENDVCEAVSAWLGLHMEKLQGST